MKGKQIYIIISAILVIGALYICDQVLELPYLVKIGIKLVLFAVFPMIYMMKTKESILVESFRNRSKPTDQKANPFRLRLSYALGIMVIIVLVVTYLIVKPMINLDVLIADFELKYKINKSNILLYGLYFAFVNSLLEEFFFRGFMFLGLKKLKMKKSAYFISSIAFSIYHIGNIQNWFHIGIFFLATFGLFVGGIIFDYLDDRQNTFFNSWFVHICADLAIVWIGYDMLS